MDELQVSTLTFSNQILKALANKGFKSSHTRPRLRELAIVYANAFGISDEESRKERQDKCFVEMVSMCKSRPLNSKALSDNTVEFAGEPSEVYVASKLPLIANATACGAADDVDALLSVNLTHLPDDDTRIRALDIPLSLRLRELEDTEFERLRAWANIRTKNPDLIKRREKLIKRVGEIMARRDREKQQA